jgi:hypothetical protein
MRLLPRTVHKYNYYLGFDPRRKNGSSVETEEITNDTRTKIPDPRGTL